MVADLSFSDIFRGITRSGRFAHLATDIPQDIISGLENDEAEAGQFICQILKGDTPDAIKNLPEETWDEIKGDYASLTDFVISLPTVVPEVLNDIEQGGTVVVSIITELIQNPGGALTVLLDGAETVFDDVIGDIKTVAGEIVSGIECLFEDCAAKTTAVTNTAEMNLVSNCQNVLAAATSTTGAATSTALAGRTSSIPAATSTTPTATSTIPAATNTLTATDTLVVTETLATSNTLIVVTSTLTTSQNRDSTTATATVTAALDPTTGGAIANGQKGVWTWGLLAALFGALVF